MAPYRIVLVDDHVLVRQGLRRIIEGAPGLQVIGEAGDGLELLGVLRGLIAHLMVLDISMPRLRGIEAINEVKTGYPQLKILMLTMHSDKEYVFQALSAGASGYLLKEDADTELFSAIEKIRGGGIYVSPRLVDALTHEWAVRRRDGRAMSEVEPLTIREREVLKLTAEGRTSKEIADVLCISYRTVEHHRAHLTAKLNVRRTADLVKYAIMRGYLHTS
jgi:DNA-binding NarL/FixJ family response regulator